MSELKKRIMEHVQGLGHWFTAVDVATALGVELDASHYFPKCTRVRRILTELCKDGMLYQFITGEGRMPSGITKTATYSVNYLNRNTELANTLLTHPNRRLNGYRIR